MDWKEYIWVIGACIYVALMFPIFFAFSFLHWTDYQISNSGLLYPAEIGAFIMIAQMFVAAALREPGKAGAGAKTEQPSPKA